MFALFDTANLRLLLFVIVVFRSLDAHTQSLPTQRLLIPPYCTTRLSSFPAIERNPAILPVVADSAFAAYFAVQPGRFGLPELNRIDLGVRFAQSGMPVAAAVWLQGTGSALFVDLTGSILVGRAVSPNFAVGGKLTVRYRRFGRIRVWVDGAWTAAAFVYLDSAWQLGATVQNFPHFHRVLPGFPLYEASISVRWQQLPQFAIESGIVLRTVAAPSVYVLFEGSEAVFPLPVRVGYQSFPVVVAATVAIPVPDWWIELTLSYQPALGIITEGAVEHRWEK